MLSRFCFLLAVFFVLTVGFACSDDSCTNDNGGGDDEQGAAIAEVSSGIDNPGKAIFNVVVTDDKGNPMSRKRIDWELLEGEGRLMSKITFSDSNGRSFNYVYSAEGKVELSPGIIKVRASLFGYKASVVMTVEVK